MSSRSDSETVNIFVKFGGKSVPITVHRDSTIKDLKVLLQQITDVLPRGQKLISRGKVLADDTSIKQSELINGVTVMLIASQGLHQGSGPVLKSAPSRPVDRTNSKAKADPNSLHSNRSRVWKITGIIALSQSNLRTVPQEVWECGSSARVLDLKNNFINELPPKIGSLATLTKVHLDHNDLSNESVSWEAFSSLKHLTILSASHNKFTSIPPELTAVSSLKQLVFSNNTLASLPSEIGSLMQLEILNVSHNRIALLPESMGDCRSLLEFDVSSNILTSLPDSLTKLVNLRSLHLSNNGLKNVPGALFTMCRNLCTLNLHRTEITADALRQCEGWEEFDKRRLLKHQKQLDFHVVGSENFDEGADKR